MKQRNLFFSLLAISFVLCFITSTLAQRPTSSPTGSGDSTKPRPKDVSPTEVKKVLDTVKITNETISSVTINSNFLNAAEPTKLPDITNTTWYVKTRDFFAEENQTLLHAFVITFRPESKIEFEEHIEGKDSTFLSGNWRQLGNDIFLTILRKDGGPLKSGTLTYSGGFLKDSHDSFGVGFFPFSCDKIENVVNFINRAKTLMAQGKLELAIKELTGAIDAFKDDVGAVVYELRAECYKKLGLNELAEADNKKAEEKTIKPKQ